MVLNHWYDLINILKRIKVDIRSEDLLNMEKREIYSCLQTGGTKMKWKLSRRTQQRFRHFRTWCQNDNSRKTCKTGYLMVTSEKRLILAAL
jgi:hypothetical protein